MNQTVRWLALILIAAAVLRLDNIGQPFVDDNAWREASVAMMADNFYRTSWNIFYPEVNWVGPGPGYQGREFQTVSYAAALLYRMVGQHDWVGRIVAVSFGLAGILGLFHLVRRLHGQVRAYAAAAMMAVMPGVVRIDRTFLPDPAMVALVTISFWALVVHLQTDRPRYLVLAVVVGTWANLTKVPGMIVGLPMLYACVWILSARRALDRRRVTSLMVGAVLSAFPVVAYYAWAHHLSTTYPPYHFAGEGNWVWDQGISAWLTQGYFLPRLGGPLVRLWGLPALGLVLLGLFLGAQDARRREPVIGLPDPEVRPAAPWLFHLWLLAGVVFYAFGAMELVENPSNFHILSPAVAVLAGQGIIWIAARVTRVRRRSAVLVTAGALIGLIAVWGHRVSRIHSSYAEDSHAMGTRLNALAGKDDLVVALGDAIGCPVAIYYSGRRGWLFPPFGEIEDWERLPSDAEAIAAFDRLREEGADWFGVVQRWNEEIVKGRPRFAAHLREACGQTESTDTYFICRIRY